MKQILIEVNKGLKYIEDSRIYYSHEFQYMGLILILKEKLVYLSNLTTIVIEVKETFTVNEVTQEEAIKINLELVQRINKAVEETTKLSILYKQQQANLK